MEEEETWQTVNGKKLAFLDANTDIAGKESTPDPQTYAALTRAYGENVEQIHLDILARRRRIAEHNEEIARLQNQLSDVHARTGLPSGTIRVTVDAPRAGNASLRFNYLAENAAWYPSYNARFVAVDQPLKITHKAHIRQSTGEDWTEVDLVLSTANAANPPPSGTVASRFIWNSSIPGCPAV
ncbi:MAG: DUF4139 domain-containing protein [Bacteroidales bacterium]